MKYTWISAFIWVVVVRFLQVRSWLRSNLIDASVTFPSAGINVKLQQTVQATKVHAVLKEILKITLLLRKNPR